MKRYSLITALVLLVVTVSGIAYAVGELQDGGAETVIEGESGPPLDLESAFIEAAKVNPTAVGDLTSFRIKNVPGRAFGFDHGNDTGTISGCAYRTSLGNSLLSASAELPTGALVTSISAHVDDTDVSENVSVSLVRVVQAGTNGEVATTLGTATSTGSAGNAEVSASINTTVGFDEFWYLEITGSDFDERVCGVEIFYNVPSEHADLVFTPVDPCVIYDSRPGQGGAGQFAANETRTIGFTGSSDLSGQGGSATGCDIPGITGSCAIVCSRVTKAVSINIVAIGPASAGQAKMWPADGTEPTQGALVNYIPGGNNSNAVPVAVGQCTGFLPSTCASDLKVKSGSSAANIRLVVTGYFTYAGYVDG